jgi:hypothetical protein
MRGLQLICKGKGKDHGTISTLLAGLGDAKGERLVLPIRMGALNAAF